MQGVNSQAMQCENLALKQEPNVLMLTMSTALFREVLVVAVGGRLVPINEEIENPSVEAKTGPPKTVVRPKRPDPPKAAKGTL